MYKGSNIDLTEFLGDGFQPGGSCISDNQSIRKQFRGSDQLRAAIGGMVSAFKEWGPVQQRADGYLYTLLGEIYAACPLIQSGTSDRDALITEVRKHKDVPDIGEDNRWDPYRKTPEELFLALILGLKDRRSTKTQWHDALKAAAAADVERSLDAFVQWIKGVGGVDGARKSLQGDKPDPDTEFATLIQHLDGLGDGQSPINVPQPLVEDELPNKIGLVLIRQVDGCNDVVPLATLADKRLIMNAIRAYLADGEKCERQNMAMFEDEQKERRKAARPKWLKYRKSGDYAGTLTEYVRDGTPEF